MRLVYRVLYKTVFYGYDVLYLGLVNVRHISSTVHHIALIVSDSIISIPTPNIISTIVIIAVVIVDIDIIVIVVFGIALRLFMVYYKH